MIKTNNTHSTHLKPNFFGISFLLFCGFLYLQFADTSAANDVKDNAHQDHKAIILLQGVAETRLKCDCFEIQYTETRREEGKTVTQFVAVDHNKIFKKHLPQGNFQGITSMTDGEITYVKTGENANSIEMVLPLSTHAFGADIYDPRLLGLSAMMNPRTTMESCLGYATERAMSVRPTVLNGISLFLVTEEQAETKWEYYIEEPDFRLWKVQIQDRDITVQIDNEYSNSAFTPFPSKVTIVRKLKEEIQMDRTIQVDSVQFKKSFPPETFTLASFNLPLNATVTDYRVNRIAGYWDGEKLVENPVRASVQEMREYEKGSGSGLGRSLRYALMFIGAGMVLTALVLRFRKRSQA